MAGIVYPDLAGTLLPLIQLDRQSARDAEVAALERARERRLDQQIEQANALQRRQSEIGPYIGPAMQGDKAALGEVASRNPALGVSLMTHLGTQADKLTAQQRQQVKDALETTSRTATGILALPPDQQGPAYEASVKQLQGMGYAKDAPPWGATAQNYLRFHASQSEHYLKQLEGMPQLMPGPGAAPGAPQAAPAAPQGATNALPLPSTSDTINRSGGAIAGIESGGGNYAALGPVANAQGDRAYGKYQVMGANIPDWTREAIGKPMTPQEFLASPQAQEAVFKTKMGQYISKYGPEGAARAWFAGEGGMNNPNAKDVLGTSVAGYGADFSRRFGGMGGVAPAGFTGAPSGVQFPGSPSMPQEALQEPPPGPAPDSEPDLADALSLNAWLQKSSPGAVMYGAKGVPVYDHLGRLRVRLPNGQDDYLAVPKPSSERQGPAGPFAGNNLESQMMNVLLNGDPDTPRYAVALAYVSRPRTAVDPTTGTMTVLPPMDTSMFRRPTGATASQPAGAPAPVQPNVQQVQVPGSGQATIIQGHGKPIPGSENETISKNVAAIGSIDKALDVMKNPTPDAQPSGRTAGFISTLGKPGELIAQQIDPDGTKVRALLADINSQLTLARSGAAVTKDEYNRLINLLPAAVDDPKVIVQKLQQVRDTYASILKGQASQYTQANGFIPHEGAQQILGAGAQAPKGADRERLLFDARKAIQQGAPRDAVIQRLKEKGIEGGL